MEEATILGEIGKLRASVFTSIDTMRKELGEKIDDSANERRAQISDLQQHGCFKGQLQDVKLQSYEKRLEDVETFDELLPRDNGKKKFSLGVGRFKTNIEGFKAGDVVLILMVMVMGWMLITQQKIMNRMNQEPSNHRQDIVSIKGTK